jgi:hypothetical protein
MLTGRCLCGAVRYEIRGTPLAMYHCHCGQCRRANGASFATNLIVRRADFAVVAGAEQVSRYESSPAKRRHFCASCGSPLYSHAEATAGIVSVRCGTLDADPGARPSAHLHVAAKAPWTELGDGLPQHAAGLAPTR